MPKDKQEQHEQSVELAHVWSDPPVEEIGAPVRTLSNKAYLRELATLQIELVKLQEWIKHKGLKVVILFEGRDAAGKGGSDQDDQPSLNPRFCRVVALGTPTEREKTQWYFQRYVAAPAGGRRDGPVRPELVQPGRGRAGDGLLHRARSTASSCAPARSSSACWSAPGSS